jgi:hypothetical protein
VPVYKNKGNIQQIENYRPYANLCSTSKIFENIIQKRILEIQETNECDLTGENQHRFKRGRSASTISFDLQSLIARVLENDEYVLLASLDLSSASDVVDINLLLKRLTVLGLPGDIVGLVEIWFRDRYTFVSIEGHNSIMYDILIGTVQGSILGPVL